MTSVYRIYHRKPLCALLGLSFPCQSAAECTCFHLMAESQNLKLLLPLCCTCFRPCLWITLLLLTVREGVVGVLFLHDLLLLEINRSII